MRISLTLNLELYMKVFGSTIAAALFCAAPALAEESGPFLLDTAGDLAQLCAAQPGDPNHAAAIHLCQGYLIGLHHMHTAVANAVGSGIYCVSPEARPTRDEASAAFAAWIGTSPEHAELEAVDAVLIWASTAFPCAN